LLVPSLTSDYLADARPEFQAPKKVLVSTLKFPENCLKRLIGGLENLGMKRILTIGASSLLAAYTASATWVDLTDPTFCQTWDFNKLATSGTSTWVNDDTGKGLTGWFAQYSSQSSTSGSQSIIADNGSSASTSLFSLGATGSSDRALGSVTPVGGTGAGTEVYGVLLRNTTGATLQNIYVNYRGEQWRYGGATGPQSLAVSYAVSSSSTTFFSNNSSQNYPGTLSPDTATGTGTQRGSSGSSYANWIAASAGNFSAPITSGTARALDGSAVANSANISFTLSSLNLANGDYIFLRWRDVNDTGNDSALAIDDVNICLTAVPEASTMAAIGAVGIIGGMTALRQYRRKVKA
jgi:hypothetical protein